MEDEPEVEECCFKIERGRKKSKGNIKYKREAKEGIQCKEKKVDRTSCC
jgi:hypothetical protein